MPVLQDPKDVFELRIKLPKELRADITAAICAAGGYTPRVATQDKAAPDYDPVTGTVPNPLSPKQFAHRYMLSQVWNLFRQYRSNKTQQDVTTIIQECDEFTGIEDPQDVTP